MKTRMVRQDKPTQWSSGGRTSPDLVVGVVAAAAELVPALGAAEVHAPTFRQRVLEPAVRACCKGGGVGGQQGQHQLLSRDDGWSCNLFSEIIGSMLGFKEEK